MHRLIAVAVSALFAANVALAQAPAAPDKPAKAAKAAAVANNCEAKAVGKNGKPLHGAAKGAFMKKCEKDAKAAK